MTLVLCYWLEVKARHGSILKKKGSSAPLHTPLNAHSPSPTSTSKCFMTQSMPYFMWQDMGVCLELEWTDATAS